MNAIAGRLIRRIGNFVDHTDQQSRFRSRPELGGAVEGVTPSERFLAALCKRSFLSLWSYSNLFTDRGRSSGPGDGKELCDLLVVFEDNVIIFSDKHCEFKRTGNIQTDWDRWRRRAIEKSTKQLYGAERWIKEHPDRVFVDRRCSERFPLKIPAGPNARYHRIAVARGVREACQAHYHGGSGSLRVSFRPNLAPGAAATDESAASLLPPTISTNLDLFQIEHTDDANGFVHVFDDFTLPVIMTELDTISDLCAYLRKKEELVRRGVLVLAAGEEELLAFYQRKMNKEGEHDFVLPAGYNAIMLDEEIWSEFSTDPRYRAKKNADKAAYVVDDLLEHFTAAHRGHQLEAHGAPNLEEYERGVRTLARLNRTQRRSVGAKILEGFRSTGPHKQRFSGGIISLSHETAFALLLMPPPPNEPYKTYREVRSLMLFEYMGVMKLRMPAIREIVGVATEPHMEGRGSSEDLIYRDLSDWTDEDASRAREAEAELGLLSKAKISKVRVREYPVTIAKRPMQLTHVEAPHLSRAERRRLAALARHRGK